MARLNVVLLPPGRCGCMHDSGVGVVRLYVALVPTDRCGHMCESGVAVIRLPLRNAMHALDTHALDRRAPLSGRWTPTPTLTQSTQTMHMVRAKRKQTRNCHTHLQRQRLPRPTPPFFQPLQLHRWDWAGMGLVQRAEQGG